MFISAGNEHVFLNELEGPKRGMLISMQPQESDGQVTLKWHLAVPAHGVL